jgi:REP element-mobilizing transposase RayT
MATYFKNKYRIETTRLPFWDYSSAGFYFVTLCTQDRENYFGRIIPETQNFASHNMTTIGKIALENWEQIPTHFPFVELDAFVIMPNHIHGLLFFNVPASIGGQKNKFGPQSKNLASVIRGYKASVKTYATKNNIQFAWQPSYHCNVVWEQKRVERIRSYIKANPKKWLEKYGSENKFANT